MFCRALHDHRVAIDLAIHPKALHGTPCSASLVPDTDTRRMQKQSRSLAQRVCQIGCFLRAWLPHVHRTLTHEGASSRQPKRASPLGHDS